MLVVTVLLLAWVIAGLLLALVVGPLLRHTALMREARRCPPDLSRLH